MYFTRATIDGAIDEAVRKLGYSGASYDQVVTIREFVLGRDVFVMLPTGSGKSLCYTALPFVFDSLRGEIRSTLIVLVDSLLRSIMEDQVRKYKARGLQAASIGKAQRQICEGRSS